MELYTCDMKKQEKPVVNSRDWKIGRRSYRILSWKQKSLFFENEFIYWRKNECISIKNPLIFRVSPLWLNHCRHLSGKLFVELLEALWSDGAPDHSCHFLDSFPLLHLDLKPQIDSTNHRKIGDINEALWICKQSRQTASV